MKPLVLSFVLTLSVISKVQADPLALSESVTTHVREIAARNPNLHDDAFSKMGGSSVVSNAFLHCFATPYVDLGERRHLAPTVEYFNAGPRSSFDRMSEAAGVSWNLRYVLGGNPAKFRRELDATEARWALVLFGGNDAQNENEAIYARRLVYLVEQLEEMGVVPVLGSALPRRSASKGRWIGRFNAITEAVARHWALPYIDYHDALDMLPRKGLAADGMHPNVLGQGGVRTACRLTEEGLRYGNNVRNLLTLQMLDVLRRIVTETETPPGEDREATSLRGGADAGAGTVAVADPPSSDSFPITTLVSKPDLPPAVSLPSRCGSPQPGARVYRERLELTERARIRASAFDLDGYRAPVYWVRVDDQGARCVRRRTQTLELDAGPGMWDLIVEVPERAARHGRMLILIARNPR
jgi:hypothetical protein